jgi:hypothetical protein
MRLYASTPAVTMVTGLIERSAWKPRRLRDASARCVEAATLVGKAQRPTRRPHPRVRDRGLIEFSAPTVSGVAVRDRPASPRAGLREYVDHYNSERPHRGLGLRAPEPSPKVIPLRPQHQTTVSRCDWLDGLVHEYAWAASACVAEFVNPTPCEPLFEPKLGAR